MGGVAKLDELPVCQRCVLVKHLMRDAAILARDCVFLEHPLGKHSRLLRLTSVALWIADHELFRILFCSSVSACQHLVLQGGEPALIDPAVFDEEFRLAKLGASGGRLVGIRKEHADMEDARR